MTPTRRVHQARAQEKRDAILQAAIELVSQGGLRAVTHRQVAARANVPVGSIGYYFETRDKLLASVVENISQQKITGLQAMLAAEESREKPSASAQVVEADAEAILNVLVTVEPSDQTVIAWVASIVDLTWENPALRDILHSYVDRIDKLLVEFLERRGYLGLKSRDISAAMGGAVTAAVRHSDSAPLAAAIDKVAELLRWSLENNSKEV